MSTLRALRERGQSETLGVALLTGIVLILVALVGLFLFADFGADDEEQLLANIDGDVEATSINLSHEGGDTFEPTNVNVVLTGDVERNNTLDGGFTAVEGGGGEFAPGDIWQSDGSGLIIGEGRLLVIHQPSSTILLDQPYSIEEDGVDLAVENHPTGNTRSDSATVHGNATWSYDLSATLGGTSYEEGDDGINYSVTFDGPGAKHLNWADDGNHEIEVYGNVSSEKSATANATIFREDGTPLSENGTVDLTVKPEPNFAVSITGATPIAGGTLSTNSGQFGTNFIGDDELKLGDSIEVTAEIVNGNSDTAVDTQRIELDAPAFENTGQGTEVTLSGGESTEVNLTADVPDSESEITPGDKYTVAVESEDSADSFEVTVNSEAFFDATVASTNAPVDVGDTLQVDVQVENTGTLSGNQELTANLTGASTYASESQPFDVGGEKQKTKTFSLDTSTVPQQGIWTVEVTTDGDGNGDTQQVALLEFTAEVTSATSGVSRESGSYDETASLDVEVSHNAPDLEDKQVNTTLTIDASALNSTVGQVTEEFTFENTVQQKTTSLTFEPDYDSLTHEDYTVSVDESATGDTDSTAVTVYKSDVNVDIDESTLPDSIDLGDNLEVDYQVFNDGNLPKDVDVNLVPTTGSNANLVHDSDGTFTLKEQSEGADASETGTLDYSNDQGAISDNFGPGDTIEFDVRAASGGQTVASDSDTVDINDVSGDDFSVGITNVNDPVQGEQMTVDTELTYDPLGVTTNGVGTQQAGIGVELVMDAGPMGKTKEMTIGVGDTLTPTFTATAPNKIEQIGTHDLEVSLKLGDTTMASDSTTMEIKPMLQIKSLNYPSNVGVNENLEVEYTIENKNTNTAGTENIVGLEITNYGGGFVAETGSVTVPAGSEVSKNLTFKKVNEFSDGDDINFEVYMNKYTGTASGTATVNADPASFTLDLKESSVSNVSKGDPITAEINVENTGDISGTKTVKFSVPSLGSDSRQITVKGGEDKNEQFSIGTTPEDVGTYDEARALLGSSIEDTKNGIKVEGAKLSIEGITASNEVELDKTFNVDVTLINNGNELGGADVTLEIGGTTKKKYVSLLPGDQTTENLEYFVDGNKHSGGENINYDIEYGSDSRTGLSVEVKEEPPDPADFDVSIDKVTPDEILQGAQFTVKVEVENNGEASGTTMVTVKSDTSAGEKNREVTVGGGNNKFEDFTFDTTASDGQSYPTVEVSENTNGTSDKDYTLTINEKTITIKVEGDRYIIPKQYEVQVVAGGSNSQTKTLTPDEPGQLAGTKEIYVRVEGAGGGGACCGGSGDGGDGGQVSGYFDATDITDVTTTTGYGGSGGTDTNVGYGGYGYSSGNDGGANSAVYSNRYGGGGGGSSAIEDQDGNLIAEAGGGGGGGYSASTPFVCGTFGGDGGGPGGNGGKCDDKSGKDGSGSYDDAIGEGVSIYDGFGADGGPGDGYLGSGEGDGGNGDVYYDALILESVVVPEQVGENEGGSVTVTVSQIDLSSDTVRLYVDGTEVNSEDVSFGGGSTSFDLSFDSSDYSVGSSAEDDTLTAEDDALTAGNSLRVR